MFSLVLDATAANIAAHADEREVHTREVQRFGQNLPDGSYSRRNRQAIAARETRIAARPRTIEEADRIASSATKLSYRQNLPGHVILPGVLPTENLSRSRAPSRAF